MKQPSSRKFEATVRHASADRFGEGLYPAILSGFALAIILTFLFPEPRIVLGIASALLVLGMVTGGENCVKVGTQSDSSGKPKGFTLSIGSEIVTLFPGISWPQVDRYKWSARGLVEEPQGFHVLPNGIVEINSEKIGLSDPDGVERLQREINKRHAVTTAHISPTLASAQSTPATVATAVPGKLHFKTRLDRFSHIIIEYALAGEREETGLRGISTLIANGLLARPKSLHVDPMQRAIEIDEIRYECTEAGARLLEVALNGRYAARSRNEKGDAIEIKEHAASCTGFDIRFMTVRAGMPVEIKDHFSQENLDILTDTTKCDLLQPGIQLRLSPPYLVIRRRRDDMGEDKVPGLPDINYLQVSAMQLQRVLNHPLIRKGGATGQQALQAAEQTIAEVVGIRVVRNPANKTQLWLECVTTDGRTRDGKAFTHHNIAELQQRGSFLPHLDVCLSLDHHVLSVLNNQTKMEERVEIDTDSTDEALAAAGRMLTRALKPPVAGPARKDGPIRVDLQQSAARSSAGSSFVETPKKEKAAIKTAANRVEAPRAGVPPTPGDNQGMAALFRETDPVRVNREVFQRLRAHFGVDVQEAHFSLPGIFDDRRFEIINFCEGEVESLLELRGGEFCGLYLSHVNEQKQVLGYACNGAHIEWGPDRCVLQPSVDKEAEDYPTSALLGLALDQNEEIAFIVQRAFKEWIKPREKYYNDLLIHFMVIAELVAAPGEYNLIWPGKSQMETAGLPLIEPPRQSPRVSGTS